MNNRISVDKVLVQERSIEYKFCLEGDWKKAFNSESMKIEYSIDVSAVPESIAIVPLLANILPIAWVYDAKIKVGECDKSFYDSIEDFKKGIKKCILCLNSVVRLKQAHWWITSQPVMVR